jgi:hypothetical protein
MLGGHALFCMLQTPDSHRLGVVLNNFCFDEGAGTEKRVLEEMLQLLHTY